MNRKWISWLLGIIVVVGVGSIMVVNYAVDYVLGSLATPTEIQTNTGTHSESVSAETPSVDKEESATMVETKEPESNQTHESVVTAPPPANKPQKTSNSTTEEKAAPDTTTNEKAAPKTTTTQEKPQGHSAYISPSMAEQVQEEITVKEKAKVARTILAKFSPSDLQYFIQLAQGGITTDEKKEAKRVFLEKLTEAEYNELIAIAVKYGLSSGRDYHETQADYAGENKDKD
jgi:cytoskeletal protein RodZ